MVMNQDTALRYPKLDNEVITVKNFLVIKEAEMKCSDITVLVGEQATGKSLLAKLRYFFWKYQQDLMNFDSFIFEGIKTFKDIEEYNKRKIKVFCELFPNIEIGEGDFFVKFESGDIFISVEKNKKSSEIRINYSDGLNNFIKNVQEAINSISASLDEEQDSENKSERVNSNLVGRRYWSLHNRVDFNNMPSVLYVLASRSFLATIQDNIFRFLHSGGYTLDLLLKQFASFWERHKQSFSDEFKNPKKNKPWFKKANKILAGDYLYENKIDYIENNWGGKVKLSNASSGQQEVLPLLAAIHAFPNKFKNNQLLIIEEPEAHIYPTAQRALVKMIADVVRKEKCKVMITTHSPYIPACVNNEIKIAKNEDDSLDVTAYHISDRTAEDIYYKKYGLINVKKLDQASIEIANEYLKQIAIEEKLQQGSKDERPD